MTTSLLSESFHLGDRDRSDGCPGALKMHVAEDGHIGRIRVPGGQLTPTIWETLADLADTFGDGDIHVTSRGNLQIRGITQDGEFAQAVRDHGLLPSPAHDRVRNIIVSPLGFAVHSLVAELDAAISRSPAARLDIAQHVLLWCPLDQPKLKPPAARSGGRIMPMKARYLVRYRVLPLGLPYYLGRYKLFAADGGRNRGRY